VQAISASSGTEISVFGTDALSRLAEIVAQKDWIIVADQSLELRPDAIAAAARLIGEEAFAAVAIVEAEQGDGEGPSLIAELPAGDLPAAGGLGMSITSSVWLSTGKAFVENVSAEAIYNDHDGGLLSAAELGRTLFHRLRAHGSEIGLVPEVGAIRRRSLRKPTRRAHWYRTAVEDAKHLGVSANVHSDPAAWLAIASLGYRKASSPVAVVAVGDLAVGHPLYSVAPTGTDLGDVARFAAALGRIDLATLLVQAEPDRSSLMEEIIDFGVNAARLRPILDLRGILVSGQSTVRVSAEGVRVSRESQDVYIHVDGTGVESCSLSFLDVFSAGHERIEMDIKWLGRGQCVFQIVAIDQATGACIGANEAPLNSKERLSMSIDMGGIFGLVTLILEFYELEGGLKDQDYFCLIKLELE
jgi:hypothetical protein